MERLRNVTDFPTLVDYLRDELDWPIDAEDAEEIVFDYDADELGIDPKFAVKINSIRQIRPLTDDQPWGVFFIEFEGKRLPVVVLRRILRAFASTTRNRDAYRPVWELEDLLFVSAFGEHTPDQREIAFAHFHQEGSELPTLRVLGWDGSDTPLKLEFVDGVLRTKLRWPDDETDHDAWRTEWSTAFRHKPRHVIRTADALADELAALARRIRDAALVLLEHESEDGPLRSLHKAFQTALIHDLNEADFADTYAQTITYGLLTAAISRTDMAEGRYGTALIAENVADMVPVTNPFLREMLEEFIIAGGRQGGINFDELGVQDVVELLRGDKTDLPAILRDFGNKTKGEDPVIHFYEHFLAAYDKTLKVQRGVFYTPKPVVSYIVRSVHELLQTEFGLEDGLADTTTWGEMATRNPDIVIPAHTEPDSPFVVLLDPATGTATFLVEAIDVIFETLQTKWRLAGLDTTEQQAAWNSYVPQHLLTRLYGYELMMAPYAIAHAKLGLKLRETGYLFESDERVRVYLTNALEPGSKQSRLVGILPALAHEAAAVASVKNRQQFSVVVGNPPYSKSMSKNPWSLKLVTDFKVGLNEKKSDLNREEWKFLRYSYHILESARVGIMGLIINNAFLTAPTHRVIRHFLMENSTNLMICNLHGDRRKGEISPDGSVDENVFDILQGVCIILASSRTVKSAASTPQIKDIFGTERYKYQQLRENTARTTEFETIDTSPPMYFFRNVVSDEAATYHKWTSLTDIFTNRNTGIQTKNDSLFSDVSANVLRHRMQDVLENISTNRSYVCSEYKLSDSAGWQVSKLEGIEYSDDSIHPFLYKPFDMRYIYYHTRALGRARHSTMQHMLKPNIALMATRQVTRLPYNHAFVSRWPIEEKSGSHDRTTQLFPLFLYPDSGEFSYEERQSALSVSFQERVGRLLHQGSNDQDLDTLSNQALRYIYAILYSPHYREEFGPQLMGDFPKIPLTAESDLFFKLAALGEKLIALHLLEFSLSQNYAHQEQQMSVHQAVAFSGDDRSVNSIPSATNAWQNGRVPINSTSGFTNIPIDTWNFHIGGYQVCHKWLKDRKGFQLSDEDILHYCKIVTALNETIRIMGEIDETIEEHGGWPIQ